MSKPKPANPALSISHPDLASALAQIGTEVAHQPLRSSALARIMRETFHGSDAGGAWDWRMAYDLMQAAAIQMLLRGGGAAGGGGGADARAVGQRHGLEGRADPVAGSGQKRQGQGFVVHAAERDRSSGGRAAQDQNQREARKQASKLISSFSVTAINISVDLIPALTNTLGKQALPWTTSTSRVSEIRLVQSGSW